MLILDAEVKESLVRLRFFYFANNNNNLAKLAKH